MAEDVRGVVDSGTRSGCLPSTPEERQYRKAEVRKQKAEKLRQHFLLSPSLGADREKC